MIIPLNNSLVCELPWIIPRGIVQQGNDLGRKWPAGNGGGKSAKGTRCLMPYVNYCNIIILVNDRRFKHHKISEQQILQVFLLFQVCGGQLMDTIINFCDHLEEDILDRASKNAKQCDLMLCLGTTLTVTPASDLVEEGKKPLKIVICNRYSGNTLTLVLLIF